MRGENRTHFPHLTFTSHTGGHGLLAELAECSQEISVTLPGSQSWPGGVAILIVLKVFDTHRKAIMASWAQVMAKVNNKGPDQQIMRGKYLTTAMSVITCLDHQIL